MNHTSTSSFSPDYRNSFDFAAKVTGAVQLDALAPRDLAWLWPGRIPLGRLTLLVGDPGLGKSLVTLDLAARVSVGAPWPDECSRHSPNAATNPCARQGDKENGRQGDSSSNPSLSLSPCLPLSLSRPPTNTDTSPTKAEPGSVLLLTAEDDLADTVLPRLTALGADCSRIVAIPSIVSPSGTGDAPAEFILHRELARLNQLLNHLTECRLLVVDPISAYLTGSANSSSEVRRLLAPLAQLAHERNLAVLAVSHLRKRDGAAVYRTLGSLVFVSAARAAWIVARDPSDRKRRLMLPIKNNLAGDDAGLAYTIEPNETGHPTIRWEIDSIGTPADEALRSTVGHPRSERNDAIAWLKRKLVAGPFPARQVQDEAEAHGIRLITLRRAFRELDGEAVRVSSGEIVGWFWRLPAKERLDPTAK